MCDGSPAGVAEALDMLDRALDHLTAVDVASLPAAVQAQALRALERAEAKHTVARARVLGAFAGQGGFEDDGHGSARAWLKWQTRVTHGAAAGAVAWARRLAAHPVIAAALGAGELSSSWARQVCGWTDRLPEARRGDADEILAGAARGGADLASLAGLAREMYERCVPVGDQDDGFEDRWFRLGITFRGAGRAEGDLTAGCAAALAAVLEALGKKAGPEDVRTGAQRRHDALEEACRRLIRAGMVPARAGQPNHVLVHLTLAQLRGLPGASAAEDAWAVARASQPGWLTGPAAEAALCDATVVPVVTGHVDDAALDRLADAFLRSHHPGAHTGGQPGQPADGPGRRPDGDSAASTARADTGSDHLVGDHAGSDSAGNGRTGNGRTDGNHAGSGQAGNGRASSGFTGNGQADGDRAGNDSAGNDSAGDGRADGGRAGGGRAGGGFADPDGGRPPGPPGTPVRRTTAPGPGTSASGAGHGFRPPGSGSAAPAARTEGTEPGSGPPTTGIGPPTTRSGLPTAGIGPPAGGPGPRPLSPAARDRLRRALLGLAADVLSGPDGLAARLRAALDGRPLTTVSLPLDIGAATETIPAHLRRAATTRHPHCAFPGCEQPATVCDIHHLIPRASGGPTSLANLVPLCGFHHLIAIHRWGWTLALHPDGTTTATSPDRTRTLHSHGPPSHSPSGHDPPRQAA
jgi:hypothetical protein